MALTDHKIGDWTHPIADELDKPVRSAAEMKEVFDSNSNELKEALNALIDDLAPVADTGSYNDLGDKPIPDSGLAGQVLRVRVTDPLTLEFGYGAGGADQVQADWNEADSDSKAYIRNKPKEPYAQSLTLTVAGWTGAETPFTQTVDAAQIEATHCAVLVSPTEASRDAYAECDVRCSAQADGSLTFLCNAKPEADVVVNVLAVFDDASADSAEPDADAEELTNSEVLTMWNNA